MFDQIAVSHRFAKSKWAVGMSLTGQCLAVGFAMLIPLIYTDSLPLVHWQNIALPSAPAPPPPAQPIAHRAVQTAPAIPKIFTAPAAIPRKVAEIVDEPAVPTPSAEIALGVSSGLASYSAPVNLLAELAQPIAIAPPVEPEKLKREEHGGAASALHVSGGVQAAKLLRRVVPIYPELAKQARISGTVRLIGVIGKDGTIQNLQVVSGHPLLVNAAIDAVRQWLYRPTLLSGEPVEVIAPIDVIFNLN